MDVIPVLDIMHGAVVRAERGNRRAYRPIVTPLAEGYTPHGIIEGFLKLHPFGRFYIADLDGIEGRTRADVLIAQLARDFPTLEFWIDNGIATKVEAEAFQEVCSARLVLGSESQSSVDLLAEMGEKAVLSLDWREETFLGPECVLNEPKLWPKNVIIMTLARVGASLGPDYAHLAMIRQRAPNHRIYAAGGVRNIADLNALTAQGIAGALVASALHDGRIAASDLAHEL